MLLKTLVNSLLIGAAIARPLQHQHHQHNEEKRDVKYVVQTDVVYVDANGVTQTPSGATAAPTVAAAASSPETKAYAPQVSSSFSSPSPSFAEAPASSSADATSSQAAESSSSSDDSSSASGKGISYSPYSDDGGCKSSSQISSEVAQLSKYDIIRLYGVDCDQVSAVMSAKASHQKIFAGIFDVANIESGVETLSSAVKSNGGWGSIHSVGVGNELVNSGSADVGQVKQYVDTAKSALKSAGYSGDVVAVDTFIAVINNPDLCDVSDYIAVNAHAYFDGGVSADQAGEWVLEQIQRVSSACGGNKKVYVTETGWPSKGDTNGDAVPSQENQKKAIDSISQKAGDDVILFTAFNDMWKQDGQYNCEKYWGLLSNN